MSFSFDEQKRFSENWESYLTAMDAVDSDMARILRANADKLAAIVRDGDRNAAARADFNSSIGSALDKMVEDADNGGAS